MSTEGGFGGSSSSDAQQSLQSFWPRVMEEIRNLTVKDFRVQELPLARIKKIMKLDEDVKRNDIAMAITKFDQFDFLIDIVPRDELKPPKRQEEVRQSVTPAEPVQYYFTLAQQPTAVQVQGQQQGQQTTSSTTTIQPGQIIIAQPQQGQTTPVTMQVGEGQQVQIVQAQPQGQAQQAQSSTGQTMQVMQQIITNTGEIQQIPVQLNAGQLQYIRLAQPVSGTQVVQGQIQTLATNAQQITQTEVQQGQQQFSQFTDGQVGYPAWAGAEGEELRGRVAGSIWVWMVRAAVLSSPNKEWTEIVKTSTVFKSGHLSFSFIDLVVTKNNLRPCSPSCCFTDE
uniref:Nuclear transcription factor Y subunit gamma n=1 Tax=Papio anubis TaxID=9555 RepID=A0A2I3LIK5_PAPAN